MFRIIYIYIYIYDFSHFADILHSAKKEYVEYINSLKHSLIFFINVQQNTFLLPVQLTTVDKINLS